MAPSKRDTYPDHGCWDCRNRQQRRCHPPEYNYICGGFTRGEPERELRLRVLRNR